MKRKVSDLDENHESVYNSIHKLVKIKDKSKLFKKFDIQMKMYRIDHTIYCDLLDFLVDNEYYILADRLIENCVNQNVDMDRLLRGDYSLLHFMTHFRANEYAKLDYYLKNGFDFGIDENWLVFFLDEIEYYEVLNYINLYNRRMKIERIRLKM